MMQTRRIGLIGDPVEHSLSPRMHAAGFEALGLDARYVLTRVPAGDAEAVAGAMRELAATGGGNVTLPHKEAAAGALDERTEAVAETGACNCFWRTPVGSLAGDNTDVSAITDVLGDLLGGRVPADVLILGAGGAAAAAAVAAGRLGARLVRVTNRTRTRGAALVARLEKLDLAARLEPWPAAGACDVLVNATSLGLSPEDALPASFDGLTPRLVLDLVYPPPPPSPAAGGGPAPGGGTALTRAAAARGITALDGLEVLVRQGAACYPRWFGVEAPLEALRRGVAGPAA